MARAPRIHRLPQRLDYTLIPAPLDLSLPLATEKSPLPAIIVTPSSPSHSQDFSIAFLAPPPKPTIRERISSYPFAPFRFSARMSIFVFLIIFILVCHVVTHRLASRRPHLEFNVQNGVVGDVHAVEGSFGNWFGFRSLWADNVPDTPREFLVTEIADDLATKIPS